MNTHLKRTYCNTIYVNMRTGGEGGYIHNVSDDSKVRAKQFWQFLGGKIFFRISCISNGQYVCNTCGTHTYIPELGKLFCTGKPKQYTLEDYPVENIAKDGYEYNYKYLKNIHRSIFKN